MARFVLVGPVVGQAPGRQYGQYNPPMTIADSAQNAVGNDVVWPSLAANPSPAMAALDQDALNAILRQVPSLGNRYITTIVPAPGPPPA